MFKRDKLTRDQESLPGSRQPDVVAVVTTPVVADVESAGSKEADVDTDTVRGETGRPSVDVFEESDITSFVIGRDEPTHLGCVRMLLECGEKLTLLVSRLAGRVLNRRLLDHEPPEERLVLAGELLIGIPFEGQEESSQLFESYSLTVQKESHARTIISQLQDELPEWSWSGDPSCHHDDIVGWRAFQAANQS